MVFWSFLVQLSWSSGETETETETDSSLSPLAQPEDTRETSGHGNQRISWVDYKDELNVSQNLSQRSGLDTNVPKTAAENTRLAEVSALSATNHELPSDPASVLSRPWSELHSDRAFYNQLPTGENWSELP